MPFPDADGDLIGDEHSLGGEAADFTTFGRVDVERAEDVATREVIEAGDLAQDSPLRSFANAWRTEQQHRMEAVGRHGLQHTNTGDEGGTDPRLCPAGAMVMGARKRDNHSA